MFPLLSVFALTTMGQTFTSGQLRYAVNGSQTVAVVGTTASVAGVVRIGQTVVNSGKTYTVSAIRSKAFENQAMMTAVTLPAQLDTIGQDAFYRCTKLVVVQGLSEVDVIAPFAFSKSGLHSLDLSEKQVNTIGAGAFSDCVAMTTFRLPNTLTAIPDAMLSGCTMLNTLQLPDALTRIGWRAFSGCKALTSLTLPESLTEIGDEAFENMAALKDITLPTGIKKMGASVFRNCTSIEELILPEELTTLGYAPFSGCSSLRKVTIGAHLQDIDDKFVFSDCEALESIEVKGSVLYSATDGVLRNRIGTKIIAYPPVLSRSVHPTLRSTSQPLAPGALMGCELSEAFQLPAQVTSLPREAMAGTTGLKNLMMASRSFLETIGERALANSRDLEALTLSAKLKSLDYCVFEGDSSLTDVHILAATPPTMPDSAFSSMTYTGAVLHTPVGKADAYKTAEAWCLFNQIIDDGTTAIDLVPATSKSTAGAIYDLSGRRVEKAEKGIFIQDRRKIMVR